MNAPHFIPLNANIIIATHSKVYYFKLEDNGVINITNNHKEGYYSNALEVLQILRGQIKVINFNLEGGNPSVLYDDIQKMIKLLFAVKNLKITINF